MLSSLFRIRFALFFACIAPMLTGCSRQYVPRVARPALCDADACVRVTGIRSIEAIGRGLGVTIAVDRGLLLRDAALVPGERGPCAEAGHDTVESIDGHPVRLSEGPFSIDAAGEHDLVFGTRAEDLDHPTRIDLLVDDAGGAARCLALDLTSDQGDLRWQPKQTAALGGSLHILFHAPVRGSTMTAGLSVLAGRWFGPVRVLAGTGIAFDMCDPSTCAPNVAKDGSRLPRTALDLPPLYLQADVFPLVGGKGYYRRHPMSVALGVGARYALVPTMLPRSDGTSSVVAYQSLAIAPTLSIVDPVRTSGLGGGPRADNVAFEIPIGFAAPLDDLRRPALSAGFAITMVSSF
jgi:hypothetical protein